MTTGGGPDRGGPDQIAGVLFDFAGTLLVPRPAGELIEMAARETGLDLSAEAHAELSTAYLDAGIPGAPYPRVIPDGLAGLYAERDLSPEAHRAAYVGLFETVEAPGDALDGLPGAVYEQILRPQGWVPYADATDVVDRVAASGRPVGMISNVGFDIRPILRHHGFERLLSHCTLSYEVEAMKPDPRIFLHALGDLGTEARATLMVGDHEHADGGAAAVGMRTLIIPMTPPRSVHGLEQVIELLDAT